MNKIFLSGGGEASDSILLDKEFVSMLDHDKPLVYIPIAATSKSYEECNRWFRSVFFPLGITKIEIWTDLTSINDERLNNSTAIYIGGGDTVKLLGSIRQSGFTQRLKDYVKHGKPVYGGSAGAIVLGADIRTAPEAHNIDKLEAAGLDILFGYSVCAHYDPSRHDTAKACPTCVHQLIAIPERSGAYIEDRILNVVGFEALYVVDGGRVVSLSPNERFEL